MKELKCNLQDHCNTSSGHQSSGSAGELVGSSSIDSHGSGWLNWYVGGWQSSSVHVYSGGDWDGSLGDSAQFTCWESHNSDWAGNTGLSGVASAVGTNGDCWASNAKVCNPCVNGNINTNGNVGN